MNHFMLPEGDGLDASGRYGAYAMELLINELLKKGARRERLQAKVFGGAQVMHNFTSMNVRERNTDFVTQYLQMARIPIIARDVLDICPRKIVLFPHSGKVMCKRLPATHGAEFEQQEARYRAQLVQQPRSGDVELF